MGIKDNAKQSPSIWNKRKAEPGSPVLTGLPHLSKFRHAGSAAKFRVLDLVLSKTESKCRRDRITE